MPSETCATLPHSVETFFVWHREGLKLEGEVIDAASDKEGALRHAEKAKVPLGKSVTVIHEGSQDIKQWAIALEAV